jgi:hypothetical protein
MGTMGIFVKILLVEVGGCQKYNRRTFNVSCLLMQSRLILADK